MKKFAMVWVGVLVMLSAQADPLETIVCKNRRDRSPVGGSQYTVTVKELSKQRGTGTKYDYLIKSEITVSKKVRFDRPAVVLKKGVVTAASEDVNYRIVSKALGLSFYVFLDEMDEAGITLYGEGTKTEVALVCDYK